MIKNETLGADVKKIARKDIKFAEYNPRTISEENLMRLRNGIEKWGLVDLPVWNKRTGNLVGGHQRLKAIDAINDGNNDYSVRVTVVDLTKEQEKALNIALNNPNLQGEFDDLKLSEILKELEGLDVDVDFDITDTGFTQEEINELIPNNDGDNENDDNIPDDVKVFSKKGDLWILGKHKLLCGDATNKQDYEKLLGDEKVDMVFTDPPYGMNLNTDFSNMVNKLDFAKEKNVKSGKKYKKVIGDNDDFKPELINTIFSTFDYCNAIFLWGADYYAELIPDKNEGSWIVWDKRLDESADKMYGSCFELCWSKTKHKREIARVKWASIFGTEQEFDHKRHHPTQKPIKLCLWFFDKWGKQGDIIIDPFAGSGSTLIACEKINRTCYAMELEPHYCDVIIRRYCDYTETKTIKLIRDGKEQTINVSETLLKG